MCRVLDIKIHTMLCWYNSIYSYRREPVWISKLKELAKMKVTKNTILVIPGKWQKYYN